MSEVARLWGPETAVRGPPRPRICRSRSRSRPAWPRRARAAPRCWRQNPGPPRRSRRPPPPRCQSLPARTSAFPRQSRGRRDRGGARRLVDRRPFRSTEPGRLGAGGDHRAARRPGAARRRRFPARRPDGRSCRPDRLSAGTVARGALPGSGRCSAGGRGTAPALRGPDAPSAGNHGPAVGSLRARARAARCRPRPGEPCRDLAHRCLDPLPRRRGAGGGARASPLRRRVGRWAPDPLLRRILLFRQIDATAGGQGGGVTGRQGTDGSGCAPEGTAEDQLARNAVGRASRRTREPARSRGADRSGRARPAGRQGADQG